MIPAILGGKPAFVSTLPLSRPYIARKDRVLRHIAEMLESGQLTDGPRAKELESVVSTRLGRECVAVSSCTTGLILVFQALGWKGEVILPSFTFFASGHALLWNDLRPVFADCDPDTFTLDPKSVADALSDRTRAILAVNIFGNPPELQALRHLAKKAGVPLIVDAAQGMGSLCRGFQAGTLGDAEVFSLTPSKLVTGGEGGLVVTSNAQLAERIRALRNYGNTGDYNPEWLGLNGRLSELQAAVALASWDCLKEHIELRQRVAARYHEKLGSLRGVRFQAVDAGNRSVYKDFGIRIGSEFGLSRDLVQQALSQENIQTRSYFNPPLHQQHLYRAFTPKVSLDHTEALSQEVLCLPISGGLSPEEVDRVAEALANIQHHAADIQSQVGQLTPAL